MSVDQIPEEMTVEEWNKEGERRFGHDMMNWKFVCPVCKHVASVAEYKAAGASQGMVGYSCIGRMMPASRKAFGGKGPGPCDYAGGGLFGLNPLRIRDQDGQVHRYFEFAQADQELVGASLSNEADNGN